MYYYIFDPPQGAKEYERTAQIKEYLSNLGIAGELVTPQPGRTIEDLVALAIAKRYSTVVAVGGIPLINRVAQALEPHDVVMGIIPLTDHQDVERIIGVKEWKAAAEQLKRRRWQHIQLGVFSNQGCFLVPATTDIPEHATFTVQTAHFQVTGSGPTTLTITPQEHHEKAVFKLETTIPIPTSKGLLQRLFKNDTLGDVPTHLYLTDFSLTTSTPLTLTVAGEAAATTPVSCSLQGKPLKLIVGRRTSSTIES